MEEILNAIAEGMNRLADTINNSKFVGGGSKINIENPVIGMRLGTCKNCGKDVELRQPWSSEDPIVNDGWYLVHCKNERCHNFTGIEVMNDEFYFASFVEWEEEFISDRSELRKNNIIIFPAP